MKPPQLDAILESVLYCRSEGMEKMRSFYEETLGLRKVFGDHPVAYRLGAGVLLIFIAEVSELQDDPPPHGASGSAHACLLATPEAYDEWKAYLTARGVGIRREIDWPGGRRSFYFDDPAGNLLEIADGDFWPT